LYSLAVQCIVLLTPCRWHSNRQQQEGLSGFIRNMVRRQYRRAGKDESCKAIAERAAAGTKCAANEPWLLYTPQRHLGAGAGCEGRVVAGYCNTPKQRWKVCTPVTTRAVGKAIGYQPYAQLGRQVVCRTPRGCSVKVHR
jgi:hypothetical protein